MAIFLLFAILLSTSNCVGFASSISDGSVSRSRQACKLAREYLAGTTVNSNSLEGYVDPQSPLYSDRVEAYWSSNCWQNASCIVSPASTEELAEMMSIISSTNATFSVRGGGHNSNRNFSSVGPNGIILDMTRFTNISLAADKRLVTVGAGNRWGTVYNSLDGTGVTVNGGRSPNPSVGGQTLGGGIGWLTNLVGVTAASVVAAEVVLANSSVIQADEEHNRELLWALKGGGPNYGIVTWFTYKTVPIDKVWFAARCYSAEQNRALLHALLDYEMTSTRDSKANIVYQLSEETGRPQSFVGFLYLDPVEWPSIFSPFYNITHAATMINSTTGTLSDLASNYYAPQYPEPGIPPSRHYVVSLPHKLDEATYNDSYAIFTKYEKQAADLGWHMNYGSQPISKLAVHKSSDTPLNLTNVEQDWVHVTLQWESAEDDSAAIKMLQEVGKKALTAVTRHGSNLRYRFANDAYREQDALASYGEGNLRKLISISRKYDPAEVFQRQQNGGWLIGSAQRN